MKNHFYKNGKDPFTFSQKRNLKKEKSKMTLGVFILFFLFSSWCSAQITGTIVDEAGEGLIGANVLEKGTSNGTTTDVYGNFTLNVAAGTMLEVSYTGYENQEIAAADKMKVILLEGVGLDEIVVTGVFDARSAMESSIAISTLDSKEMERLAPSSTADLFSNTPGVFVNASLGETRNAVHTRGISAGSNYSLTGDVNGFFYLSLQEDGLPVTAVSDAVFVSDLFFRADNSVKRLESVRGGSSSITSVNAPGGIFNFLTKTGTERSKMVEAKFGLEGNLEQPYYRLGFNYGDKIGSDLSYNIGGFYRRANGAYNVGYPLNNGGQIKANVTKLYKGGSVRVFAKYLNDINGQTQVLPVTGFDDFKIPDGVSFGDSYIFPEGDVTVPDGRGGTKTFTPNKPQQSTDIAAGFNWSHDLGKGWSIKNDFKYSAKTFNASSNAATTFTSFFDPTSYFFLGVFGPPGSANFPGRVTLTNSETGETAAIVDFTPPSPPGAPPSPPVIDLIENNLPSSVPNSFLYSGSRLFEGSLNEVMNQLSFSKKWKNTGINFGWFGSNSQFNSYEQTATLTGISSIQDKPVPLTATFEAIDGRVFQVSNDQGYYALGGRFGYGDLDMSINQNAFFFGNNISLADDKLTIDWGLRSEISRVDGVTDRSVPDTTPGGIDGDPLTLYDNFSGVLGVNEIEYNTSLNSFAFSAGVNYRLNKNNAFYVRFASGQKAPDLRFYAAYTSQFAVDNVPPRNQNITQFEVAYKVRNEKVKAAITPFYSQLSDVATIVLTADETNTLYFPEPQFNEQRTVGVELELDWNVAKNFTIRAGATIQDAEYTDWKIWNPNDAIREDDELVDYSGNKAENTPNLLINLTPTYATEKFFALVQYRYTGERWANQPNAFKMPGFSQVNLGAGYNFTKNISFAVNVNNAFNTLGVNSSFAPGSILESFNPNRVTAESIAANPDALHAVVPILPRSMYFTLKYEF